jgi:hypothetical protein
MALLVLILLGVVQFSVAWIGVELAMNPPQTFAGKRHYKFLFITLALVGILLAFWQYRIQEKHDAAGEAKLDRIDTGVSNIQVFVKRDFSNQTSMWTTPSGLPVETSIQAPPLENETNIVSELASAKPIETVIWLTSSQPRARQVAEQIEGIFKRGGFSTAHVVRDIPGGQNMFPSQIATTNGVQVLSKEITEPALTDALIRLMRSFGSKSELWAGQTASAPLVVAVRDQ